MNKEYVLTKNDEAWNKLFEKYDILNKIEQTNSYKITAEQIIEFREPRLMTKFDHTINLPKIFTDNKLSILPVTRGSYIISRFKAYHNFENESSDIIKVSLPSYIQSLDYSKIKSEAIALNCAVASGIIAGFVEDGSLLATVSGRMGSGKFEFNIQDISTKSFQHINVENSQIEIDAAYEGENYLTIFEAKRDLSKDFLVRQLYYPYRVWKSKVTKKVKLVFLIYSNGIYRMYEYAFENPNEYNSLVLVKQQNYSLEDTEISLNDIQTIMTTVKYVDEPKVSFPQADIFERVINLCELLNEHDMARDKVTEEYDFDARQTNYYTDAARYLGMLEKARKNKVIKYSLTPLGKKILNMCFKKRQLALCELILSHKVFNDVLKLYFSHGVMPEKCEIVGLMKESKLYNVNSDETFGRRASTIKNWINWIVGLINE